MRDAVADIRFRIPFDGLAEVLRGSQTPRGDDVTSAIMLQGLVSARECRKAFGEHEAAIDGSTELAFD
jgi:hypothetical protein